MTRRDVLKGGNGFRETSSISIDDVGIESNIANIYPQVTHILFYISKV